MLYRLDNIKEGLVEEDEPERVSKLNVMEDIAAEEQCASCCTVQRVCDCRRGMRLVLKYKYIYSAGSAVQSLFVFQCHT